tara:strand:+ start:3077 stop:4693 length:1617 start_codon:yes stop_codon:yes gene_type:complete
MRWLACIVGVLALFVTNAAAQDTPVQRVEIQVLSVDADTVRVDRGRSAGIQSGDRVRIFAAGLPTIEGTVQSVREDSCRVEIPSGTIGIDPGTSGEVLVPVDRDAAVDLPWTAPSEDFDPNSPLLLGQATPSSEREPAWRGRTFLQGEWAGSSGAGSSDNYFTNLGVDVLYENPFARGGRLHLNADLWTRAVDVDGGLDVSQARLRFDRLSYSFGGTRTQPDRWQFGRFLQHEFPELGVLDGVEFGRRLENGSRVGGSIGFLPETYEDFRTGEDLAAAMFYRHLMGAEDRIALGASYQKTWHAGKSDRDLFLTTLDMRVNQHVNVWSTAWIDAYGSSAANKSSGLELTQFVSGVTWANRSRQGATFSLTQTRWPELLRDGFASLDPNLLANGKVDRARVQGWTPLSENVHLRASIDRWSDQDASGDGMEVFVGWREILGEHSELGLAVFNRDAKFNDVQGYRLTGYRMTDLGTFRATVEPSRVSGATADGSSKDNQLRLRGSWDQRLGIDWYLSVYAQTTSFGGIDTRTLGFHLQRSF